MKDAIGYAPELAQKGERTGNTKVLKGFGGAGVLEIVADYDGDTWRAVYTVTIAERVYVHFFLKKSKKGIATPKKETDLIKRRLREAVEHGKAGRS